mmetsp:Transcript_16069/g.23385  ORF Transcript_16069/g.23385 Transcript_16069/m.23385 type:complete len:202 (-) Transcript_16069:81-686(-)
MSSFRLALLCCALVLLIAGGDGQSQSCKTFSPLNCRTSQSLSNSEMVLSGNTYLELQLEVGSVKKLMGWMEMTTNSTGLTFSFLDMKQPVVSASFGLWPCHALPEDDSDKWQVVVSDPSDSVYLPYQCIPYDCCYNLPSGSLTVGPNNIVLSSFAPDTCLVMGVSIDNGIGTSLIQPYDDCTVSSGKNAVCSVSLQCNAKD